MFIFPVSQLARIVRLFLRLTLPLVHSSVHVIVSSSAAVPVGWGNNIVT